MLVNVGSIVPVELEEVDLLDLLPLHSLYYRDNPGRTHLARFFEHPQMAATTNGWFRREAILEFIAEHSNEAAPSSGLLSDLLERTEQLPGLANPVDTNSGRRIRTYDLRVMRQLALIRKWP